MNTQFWQNNRVGDRTVRRRGRYDEITTAVDGDAVITR